MLLRRLPGVQVRVRVEADRLHRHTRQVRLRVLLHHVAARRVCHLPGVPRPVLLRVPVNLPVRQLRKRGKVCREGGFSMDKSGDISANDLCRIIISELRELKWEARANKEIFNSAIDAAEDKITKVYKREAGYDLYAG